MSKNLFITGTGTDIGKTYVTGLMIKKLQESGLKAAYYKAAMSGNDRREDGSLIPGDAVRVKNMGSIIFFVGLPPRNVLICYATLDRMEKQCCSFITDGEELKNNLLFLRQAT